MTIDDPKEASQIHNRGHFGYPISGGGLELDLIEAGYLMEAGRLEVTDRRGKISFESLVRHASREVEDFGTRYIVYRDIRQRGFVIKPDYGEFNFRVFPRGGTPNDSQTRHWIKAIPERAIFDVSEYQTLLETSEHTRKDLLLAVVDEEGDLTYYTLERSRPKGSLCIDVGGTATGFLVRDRVLVFDEDEMGPLSVPFYGKRIGATLQLSLIESVHLMDLGALRVRNSRTGKELTRQGVASRAARAQEGFELRLAAFKDMRGRGLLVKTGFKYGTHFRVYEQDPDKGHARFLVHAVPKDYRTTWPEVSRGVRLAHGVKKEWLLARVGEDEVGYLKFRRVRP